MGICLDLNLQLIYGEYFNMRQFPTKVKYIEQLSDLPAAVAGVITQPDNTNWQFVGTVNLGSNRIVLGQNGVISGQSPKNTIVTTSNAGAMFTSTSNAAFYNISMVNTGAGTMFSFNGSGIVGTSVVLFDTVEIDNARLGTIQNYAIINHDNCLFTNLLGGMTIDGTVSSVVYTTVSFSTVTSGVTCLTFPSTLTVASRIRFSAVGMSVVSGATAVNLSTSATIGGEAYVGSLMNFSGAGTYLAGVQPTDNKAFFANCKGVANSKANFRITMQGNGTTTVIPNTTNFVKVAGTTTSALLERFTAPVSNRGTYSGVSPLRMFVTATMAMQSGNNNTLYAGISKNGTLQSGSEIAFLTSGSGAAQAITVQDIIEMVSTDYVEIVVRNATAANNITVTDMTFLAILT